MSNKFKDVVKLTQSIDKQVKRFVEGLSNMVKALQRKSKNKDGAASQVLITVLFVNILFCFRSVYDPVAIGQALSKLGSMFIFAAKMYEDGEKDDKKVIQSCLNMESEIVVRPMVEQPQPSETVH